MMCFVQEAGFDLQGYADEVSIATTARKSGLESFGNTFCFY